MISLKNQENIFGDFVSDKPNIDRQQLANFLREILKDITLPELVGMITNKFNEAIQYTDLCNGGRSCQKTSLLFNPHRLTTQVKGKKESVFTALHQEKHMSGLARVVLYRRWQEHHEMEQLLYRCLEFGVNGQQLANEYPPPVARDLCYSHKLNKESKILDPCAGWGGRMIGVSVVSNHYFAYEPATQTYNGLLELEKFLKLFRTDFEGKVRNCPYEDVPVKPDYYDFALTSPPYYDTEQYSDEETNSFNRYKTFDEWVAGFYKPLILNTMASLKDGACFVLNIGSRKYPMSQTMREIVGDQYMIQKMGDKLAGHQGGLGKKGEGESFFSIRKIKP